MLMSLAFSNNEKSKVLVRGENHFVIGVGEYDYLPHTGFVDGKFTGFGVALLDAFANSKGYVFEYKSVPILRMFKVFLDETSVDFMYPNNSYWNEENQKKRKVAFSDSVVSYVDGMIVQEKNRKITLSELNNVGILNGFDPIQYIDKIKDKKIILHNQNNVVSLLKMVLKQRVQAAYLNPLVAAYYVKKEIKTDEVLVLAENLPYIKSNYCFSTIKYKKIINEFNDFLVKEHLFVEKLKIKYGVQHPFLKDPQKYKLPAVL